MLQIPDYAIIEYIYKDETNAIVRAYHQKKNQTVILKTLISDFPQMEDIQRLKHEYSILNRFKHENIIKPISILTSANNIYLIFEDNPKFFCLSETIKQGPLSIENFLKIAIKLVDVLEYLNKQGIIHNDIKPDNIIYNAETGEIKLIDFSLAIEVGESGVYKKEEDSLKGTLAYISPENTGRIGNLIDFRSDFYSIGVTFYELITGRLPLEASDPMEWVYQQLVKIPIPPHIINPTIPKMISDLIMLLLEKDPDKRYQNSMGILADLKKCESLYEKEGVITEFKLKAHDVVTIFREPQGIYGRDEVLSEVETFITEKKDVIKIAIIGGRKGIGKTKVLQYLANKLQQKKYNVLFTSVAKKEKNSAGSSLMKGFSALINLLLGESDDEIKKWKGLFLESLGQNANIISDIVPNFEHIVGKQGKITELSPLENENRFNATVQAFIETLIKVQNEFYIVLDDFELVDEQSEKIVSDLLVGEYNQKIRLIIASLEDELLERSPTSNLVYRLKQTNKEVYRVDLKPLSMEETTEFITEHIRLSENLSSKLTHILHMKTGGNPLYLHQLMGKISSMHLLHYDYKNNEWSANFKKIEGLEIPKNIEEQLLITFGDLPVETKQMLSLAAIIGRRFKLSLLTIIAGKNINEVYYKLSEAIKRNIIYEDEETKLLSYAEKKYFKFAHARLQEIAIHQLPELDIKKAHLNVARFLLSGLPEDPKPDKLFHLVNHYNQAMDQLVDENEIKKVIELNVLSGNKLLLTISYDHAKICYQSAIQLHENKKLKNLDDLIRECYHGLMSALLMKNEYEEMENYYHRFEKNSTQLSECASLYIFLITSDIKRKDFADALDKSIAMLKKLGFGPPTSPNKMIDLKLMVFVLTKLFFKSDKKLKNLKVNKNKNIDAAINIYKQMITIAVVYDQRWIPYTVLSIVNLTLKYGVTPHSSSGFLFLGQIFFKLFNNPARGLTLGKIAMHYAKVFKENKSELITAKTMYYIFFAFLIGDLSHSLKTLNTFHRVGLMYGNYEYGGLAKALYLNYRLFTWSNFSDLEKAFKKSKTVFVQLGEKNLFEMYSILYQFVLNMMGESQDPTKLVGKAFDETKNEGNLFLANTIKGILCYHFEEYDQAINYFDHAYQLSGKINPFPFALYLNFYYLFAKYQTYRRSDAREQRKILRMSDKLLKHVKAIMDVYPNNINDLYYLLLAEKYKVTDKNSLAQLHYEKAISASEMNGKLFHIGFSSELFSKYLIEKNQLKFAKLSMTYARYYYSRAAAIAKTEFIDKHYQHLMMFTENTSPIHRTSPDKLGSKQLDIISIVKSSQAISSELDLKGLIKRYLSIITENSGAERAILFLDRDGQLYVEGTYSISQGVENLLSSKSFNEYHHCPQSIILYVQRTMANLAINDLAMDKEFGQDNYLRQNKPKSLLCFPIIYQNDFIGAIYLENYSFTRSFTNERIELISILTSQIAISIQNAKLYKHILKLNESLEQRVLQRTSELSSALENLQATQSQLIESEKMAALGQLIAGIAHEINTPLGAIKASSSNIQHSINEIIKLLPQFINKLSDAEIALLFDLIKSRLTRFKELARKERRALLQCIYDKFSDEGIQQADLIADLLVNMGVYENIEHYDSLIHSRDALKIFQLAYDISSLSQNSNNIDYAIQKASKIVFALRNYAHRDNEETLKKSDIAEDMDTILTLFQNQIKRGIQVIKNYKLGEIIYCYPDRLNQVWSNLITNAIYAMNYQGTLTITIRSEGSDLIVSIEDTGAGIPKENMEVIFKPFFTTKPRGEGTGLGLDICKKIVEDHQGSIEVVSQPGCTIFTVKISKHLNETAGMHS